MFKKSSLSNSVLAGILAVVVAQSVHAQENTPPHTSSLISPNARFEIVQSQLVFRNTFRLDRTCGAVSQLVLASNDEQAWEPMGIVKLPPCVFDGKLHYQLFMSALATKGTFLMNTDSGKSWVLVRGVGKDNKDTGRFWAPFVE